MQCVEQTTKNHVVSTVLWRGGDVEEERRKKRFATFKADLFVRVFKCVRVNTTSNLSLNFISDVPELCVHNSIVTGTLREF